MIRSLCDICGGYLPYKNIYVAPGATQKQMADDAATYINMLGTYGDANCKVAPTFRTLCTFFFLECVEYNRTTGSQTLVFPQRTCRENCAERLGACQASQYYDCTQMTQQDGKSIPMYPPVAMPTVYNLTAYGAADPLFTVPCFNSTDPANYPDNNTVITSFCQAPLIYRNTTLHNRWEDEPKGYSFMTDTSDCLIPCPAPTYTIKQWSAFYSMVDTMSVMSAISSLFMIITYGPLNREPTNYERMLLFQFGSLFLRSLSGVIVVANGGAKHTMCPEPGRSATSIDPLCVASGVIFYAFSLNAILWWTFLVFDLWCIVRKVRQLRTLWFFIGSTLFTIACTVVVSVKGRYIADKGNVISNVAWEIAKPFVMAQVGPFTYICVLYVTYFYILIYNRTYHIAYQSYRASGALHWFNCIIQAGVNGTSPDECLVAGPIIGTFALFTAFLHIFGIYTLFFAFSSKFVYIWKDTFNRLRNFFNRSPDNMSSMGSAGVTSSGGTGTTGSSSSGVSSGSSGSSTSFVHGNHRPKQTDPYMDDSETKTFKEEKNTIQLVDLSPPEPVAVVQDDSNNNNHTVSTIIISQDQPVDLASVDSSFPVQEAPQPSTPTTNDTNSPSNQEPAGDHHI
eukprot:gene206-250_t